MRSSILLAASLLRPASLLCAAVLTACGGVPSGGDAGVRDAGPDESDSSIPACDVDRACPAYPPVWGGPCEGTLSCDFITMCGSDTRDRYECVAGEWTLTMPGACAGGGIPLNESCGDPFTGTLPGARVYLTADRAGAPEIMDGDLVLVAFGAQGLAMLPLRLHVESDTDVACVRMVSTLTLEGMPSAPTTHSVRLRCGSSLRIQDVLPDLPCEEREYAASIDVEVDGAGMLHRDVRLLGGGCTFGG